MKKRLEGHVLKPDQLFDSERLIPISSTGHLKPNSPDSLIHPGDIIIAGRNFGGANEKFPEVLKEAGVACVIAASFSRPFYRNSINLGLPLVECPEAVDKIATGETIAVDFESGKIACKRGSLTFTPHPEIIARILASGGLIPHIKRSLGK